MSYRSVVERVAAAARRAGRDVESITLVAVAKTMSAEEIMSVYAMGHRDFGENRAQELADKASLLPDDIRWHFVGSLQSNKARLVRPVTHLLHSMDRASLAKAWLKGPGNAPPTLLEVNVAVEPQKTGVALEDSAEMVEQLSSMGIEIRGLMAIPPQPERAEDSRVHFRRLRSIRDSIVGTHPSVTALSMGMSDDFEVAIEEGASLIRVGRAIFGPRN